jgi:hypothetical protein
VTTTGGIVTDPSELANFANVPICPDFGPRDYEGLPWRLDVDVTGRDGRTAKSSISVVPTCPVETNGTVPGHVDCRCECRANYTFGKQCDGG